MKKVLLLGIVAVLFLIPSVAFAYSGDTATGTTITATGTENTLTYTDTGGTLQPTEEATNLDTTVVSMYGFADLGAPADQSTTAGVAVTYDYVITNEGNASDTYGITFEVSYGGSASNWTFAIQKESDDSTIESTEGDVGLSDAVGEDAEFGFYLTVLPSTSQSESPDGGSATVTVTVTTDSTPVGDYTGANGNEYGGTDADNDATITTISAGEMTLSRVATVDAPTEYITNRGGNLGHHDAVPGAVITYTLTVSNEGSNDAENVIIVDKVPTNTKGIHVGAGVGDQGDVVNVDVTAADPTFGGWTASYSTSATPNKHYGDTGDWTAVPAGLTIESTATFVKWERSSITPGTNGTLTWGVAIE
jgi:uncharacterized repeat protein (TIGR01451 family)